MYALGVGKAIEQELQEIASDPVEKHVYYAKDFEKMGEITTKLKAMICKGNSQMTKQAVSENKRLQHNRQGQYSWKCSVNMFIS